MSQTPESQDSNGALLGDCGVAGFCELLRGDMCPGIEADNVGDGGFVALKLLILSEPEEFSSSSVSAPRTSKLSIESVRDLSFGLKIAAKRCFFGCCAVLVLVFMPAIDRRGSRATHSQPPSTQARTGYFDRATQNYVFWFRVNCQLGIQKTPLYSILDWDQCHSAFLRLREVHLCSCWIGWASCFYAT